MVVTGCAGKEDTYTPTGGIPRVNKWVSQVRGSSTQAGQYKMLDGYTERAAYQDITPLERAENLSNPAGSRPVDERTLRC